MNMKNKSILLTNPQQEIDAYFLGEAYKYGNKYSDDPSTATGVVFVKNKRVWASGANRLPDGVKLTDAILALDKNAKYEYIAHAERDAIARAANLGNPLSGSKLYSPWTPCAPCAGAILNAGSIEVITHKELQDLSSKLDTRLGDSQKYAEDMFAQAGVTFRSVSFYLGHDDKGQEIAIRFKYKNYVQNPDSFEFVEKK